VKSLLYSDLLLLAEKFVLKAQISYLDLMR